MAKANRHSSPTYFWATPCTKLKRESSVGNDKVLGAWDGQSEWVINAIIDAANNHSDVINLSLGTYKARTDKDEKLMLDAYSKAVKYANKKGAVVVASAGNDASDLDELKREKLLHLPSGLPQSVSVSSNTINDTLASYSNFGREIDFSAPGGDMLNNGEVDLFSMIITTYPSDRGNALLDQLLGIPQGYTLNVGTSLAVPQVSAAAALIISEYKDINGRKPGVKTTIKYLRDGSVDIGKRGNDDYFGEGKVNAYRSLQKLN